MIAMVAALLIGICILTVALYVSAQLGRRRIRRAAEQALGPAPPAVSLRTPSGSDGELAEVTLVSALLARELSTAEYQWGMALLAAGDAVQHPLEVPPEFSA
jgi:hypothetical protein